MRYREKKLIEGTMKDGRPVTILQHDLMDRIPAFDKKMKRFECYTTHFRCNLFELYSQLPKSEVSSPETIYELRLNLDYKLLDKHGVDVKTLRDVN